MTMFEPVSAGKKGTDMTALNNSQTENYQSAESRISIERLRCRFRRNTLAVHANTIIKRLALTKATVKN